MLIKNFIKEAPIEEKQFDQDISEQKFKQLLSSEYFDQHKNDLNLNIENQFVGQISMTEIQRHSDKAERNKLYFSLNRLELVDFKHSEQINTNLNELYYFDEIIEEKDRQGLLYFCFTEEYSNNTSIVHLLSSKSFDSQSENVINASLDRVMIVDDKLMNARNIYNRLLLLNQEDITLSAASLFNFFGGNDKLFQVTLDEIKKIKKYDQFDVKENILIINKQKQPVLTLTTKHKNLLKLYLQTGLQVCNKSQQMLGNEMVKQFEQRIQQMKKQLN